MLVNNLNGNDFNENVCNLKFASVYKYFIDVPLLRKNDTKKKAKIIFPRN